jgi:hypothetical protein
VAQLLCESDPPRTAAGLWGLLLLSQHPGVYGQGMTEPLPLPVISNRHDASRGNTWVRAAGSKAGRPVEGRWMGEVGCIAETIGGRHARLGMESKPCCESIHLQQYPAPFPIAEYSCCTQMHDRHIVLLLDTLAYHSVLDLVASTPTVSHPLDTAATNSCFTQFLYTASQHSYCTQLLHTAIVHSC